MNRKGNVPAIAVALGVLLVIFILATSNPQLKQTIIEILKALRGG